MPEVIYLDGRFVAPEQAVISIHDRGFLFGDAVYEVFRSYEGRIWALERHLRRLQRSLEEIDLARVDAHEIGSIVQAANRRSEFPNASIYVQVTRGVQPRRHAYPRDLTPTVLVTVRDIAPMLERINFAGESALTMPDLRWRRCDVKSTNLLPNVLAHTQAIEQGAHEAILVDSDGCITEAASMSVFCVEQGVLLTTPLGPAILPSITRQFVIEVAQDEGLPFREERVPLGRWRAAQEMMFASTSHEVCPITLLDGQPVGDGRPGPITRRLMAAFKEKVATQDDALR